MQIPNIYAAPGSVFVEADSSSLAGLDAAVAEGRVTARAGAKIDILNNTPFTMTVNDAIIKDSKVITTVNGQYTVLNPGNVYFNNGARGTVVGPNASDKEISIVQNKLLGTYDLGGLPPVTLDQDLYIVGDVVNETGLVKIRNEEGSITVSGEIRGNPVEIYAFKDFTLNSDDWFHTGRDPRQVIDFDAMRRAVFNTEGTYHDLSFATADAVRGDSEDVDPNLDVDVNLDAAITAPGARILAQGTIAITARYLNINGLIQSGAQNVELHIDDTFEGSATGELIAANGNPLAGVSFGTEAIPVKAYFDAAQQAIVVEDLVPEGGRVILAGQILSTRRRPHQGGLRLRQCQHHERQRLQAHRQPGRHDEEPRRQGHDHRHRAHQQYGRR